MKRGQAEQFNWIFIIVSGAVILGFFTLFAVKFIQLQETRQDVRSIIDLGGALDTLERLQVGDEGFFVDSDLPDEGLRFGYDINLNYECIDDKSTLFIDSGEIANYELEDEIVFINSENELNSLDMGVIPWSYPFHITNFIYLSDPKINYYFVYDSESRDQVNEFELGAIDFELVRDNEVEIEDNSKYVYFTKRMPSIAEDSNFVYVDLDNEEVYFYDDGWQGPVKYYGEEMMFGAIFSNNLEHYQCNVNKALNKLKENSGIYLEKAKILSQITRECDYSPLINLLGRFADGDYEDLEKLNELNKREAGCLWVF